MYHILVIDDEKAILDAIKIALSRAGFKVEIALDGIEGIQKFNSGQFDLVITDILMPGLNGGDVVDHIHNSDRPYIPIIGISGTPWLFENIQFDAVFIKPFPLEDLVNSIRHNISMQLTRDEVFRQKRLPIVGQIVRNKKYGTFWRVMEEREIWQHTANHPQSGEGGMIIAIYLAYWKVQKDLMPGIGKMIGYAYTLHDNTFESNWDVVEDR